MNYKFVLTGGPGAGKTTVLKALSQSGYFCAPESARKIIKTRLSKGLSRRPTDFARQILESDDLQYHKKDNVSRPCFFDRGVLDALYMLDASNEMSVQEIDAYIEKYSYNNIVFLFPHWQEIYRNDNERDQTFAMALEVYKGIKEWYLKQGYEAVEITEGECF